MADRPALDPDTLTDDQLFAGARVIASYDPEADDPSQFVCNLLRAIQAVPCLPPPK